jgi:hypothetical protein
VAGDIVQFVGSSNIDGKVVAASTHATFAKVASTDTYFNYFRAAAIVTVGSSFRATTFTSTYRHRNANVTSTTYGATYSALADTGGIFTTTGGTGALWSVSCNINFGTQDKYNLIMVNRASGQTGAYSLPASTGVATTTARVVARMHAAAKTLHWTGYLPAGNTVSCGYTESRGTVTGATHTLTTWNSHIGLAAIEAGSAHAFTTASTVVTVSDATYTSNYVTWSFANIQSPNAGFASGNFQSGYLTVPTEGVYTVTFSVYLTVDEAPRIAIIKNPTFTAAAPATGVTSGTSNVIVARHWSASTVHDATVTATVYLMTGDTLACVFWGPLGTTMTIDASYTILSIAILPSSLPVVQPAPVVITLSPTPTTRVFSIRPADQATGPPTPNRYIQVSEILAGGVSGSTSTLSSCFNADCATYGGFRARDGNTATSCYSGQGDTYPFLDVIYTTRTTAFTSVVVWNVNDAGLYSRISNHNIFYNQTHLNVPLVAMGFESGAASYTLSVNPNTLLGSEHFLTTGISNSAPLGTIRQYRRVSNLIGHVMTTTTITFPPWLKGFSFWLTYVVFGSSTTISYALPTATGMSYDHGADSMSAPATGVSSDRLLFAAKFTITTNGQAVITFPTMTLPTSLTLGRVGMEQTGLDAPGGRAEYTLTSPSTTNRLGSSRTLVGVNTAGITFANANTITFPTTLPTAGSTTGSTNVNTRAFRIYWYIAGTAAGTQTYPTITCNSCTLHSNVASTTISNSRMFQLMRIYTTASSGVSVVFSGGAAFPSSATGRLVIEEVFYDD